MVNLSLRQLRYFEALARYGHFGRAADDCAISQPALSVQIKEMEATLGMQLFERGARQVRLTQFGEVVAPRVRQIVQELGELEDLARASRAALSGRLHLGVIPTIAPYLLPGVIAGVADIFPDLDLHVRESLTARLLNELTEGRLDAAIVALPVSEPSMTEVALFEEDFVLVRPTCEQDRPVPDADALRQMRLLLLEEGHCFRAQALAFCDIATAPPREVLDASSLTTLVQMVGAGMGVTLIPEMAVEVETRSAAVSVARFGAPQPQRTIGMVWRKSSALESQLNQIAGIVRTFAPNVPGR